MTWQTREPLEKLRAAHSAREARGLVDMVRAGDLTLTPPYQRGPVWNTDQRIGLIRSSMTRVPIPAIIINDRGTAAWTETSGEPTLTEPVYACVDGRQRLETYRLWFDGKLHVPVSWWPADAFHHDALPKPTPDGDYVTFNDLTRAYQRVCEHRFVVPTVEAHVASVADEAAIYLLVNGAGTPQTDTDLTRARRIATPGGTL
jgi:hypothetical protein